MPDPSLEDLIYEHVLGAGAPGEMLIENGEFPAGWVDRYVELVRALTERYTGQAVLPRRVVWAVQFASWYLPLRYNVWCKSSGQSNQKTVGELGRLRTPSEIFIYGAEHEAGS